MKADQFLRETILELKDIEEDKLTPQLPIDELGFESLDYVEIQVGIKKNFGVEIDPGLFQSGAIKTLGDLSRYIEEQSSARAVAA